MLPYKVMAPIVTIEASTTPGEMYVTLNVHREFIDDYSLEAGDIFELNCEARSQAKRKKAKRKRSK